MLFKELSLSAELLRAVEKKGYDEATPIQQQAIPEALKGRDVLGLAISASLNAPLEGRNQGHGTFRL